MRARCSRANSQRAADGGESRLGPRSHGARARASRSRRDAGARWFARGDAILDEDRAMCRRIGEHGATLIPRRRARAHALQHRRAGDRRNRHGARRRSTSRRSRGKRSHVYADETRPLLQGSRLTAWELARAGIPVTVLVDGAAASLMARRRGRSVYRRRGPHRGERRRREQDRDVSVGDRRADTTAFRSMSPRRQHLRPARRRTADRFSIEQRNADEVRCGFGAPTAPAGVDVYNPAFDVTPASLITAIVSDRGVHRPPYDFAESRR